MGVSECVGSSVDEDACHVSVPVHPCGGDPECVEGYSLVSMKLESPCKVIESCWTTVERGDVCRNRGRGTIRYDS